MEEKHWDGIMIILFLKTVVGMYVVGKRAIK
jgi:hypothetical protein